MFLRPRLIPLIRHFSQTAGKGTGSGSAAGPSAPPPPAGIADVQGLSSRCVRSTTEPVGPGASTTGEYKVPEYFCFSRVSYHEAEVELAKYRCPQPSAGRK